MIYIANLYIHGYFGYHRTINKLVVAPNEADARDQLQQSEPTVDSSLWALQPVDPGHSGCYDVSDWEG